MRRGDADAQDRRARRDCARHRQFAGDDRGRARQRHRCDFDGRRGPAFLAEFDAAFSNATLHWVLEKEQAARAIFRSLKPGGRFAGEMGGEGNLAQLREALDEELIIRGYVPPVEASNWYASPEEFAEVYEAAGFEQVDARLIERPTAIEHGVAQWVTTFRRGWLDRAGVPEGERDEIGAAVADRVGSNIADYVRLRFIMRKPN